MQGTVSMLPAPPVTAHAKPTVLAGDDEKQSSLCMTRRRPGSAAQSACCQRCLPWQAHVMQENTACCKTPCLQQEAIRHALPASAVPAHCLRAQIEKDEPNDPASPCCHATHRALNKLKGWLDAHKCSMMPPLTVSLATSPGFAGSSASPAAKVDAEEIVKEHRLDR